MSQNTLHVLLIIHGKPNQYLCHYNSQHSQDQFINVAPNKHENLKYPKTPQTTYKP